MQSQKLVKIKEMLGPERQEEEPEWEIIVGPIGEVLKPHDTGTSSLFYQRNLSTPNTPNLEVIHPPLHCQFYEK